MGTQACGGVLATLLLTCAAAGEAPATFGDDADFLLKHTDGFILGKGPAQIVVVPAYQGRVMTSTARGSEGFSNGWINRKLIESGQLEPHINPFGGEDRFWLGPEGGQFALFFAPGSAFVFDAWQTPAPIDTETYPVAEKSEDRALFRHAFTLTNYTGTELKLGVEREVKLLDRAAVAEAFGAAVPEGVDLVAYQTANRVTNRGEAAWQKESGVPSIWILGMYNPGPHATVVIPFQAGPERELGPKVNAAYFGDIPPERLVVRDDVLFFKADGRQRGKLGLSPQRAKGAAGSYDADTRMLTLVSYTQPKEHAGYVNSMWEHQEEPFSGDVINSYNDGPVAPDKPPLGPFYELETSSPALLLAPGASYEHVQRTVHLTGSEAALDPIARKVLGVGLDEVKRAFQQ